MKHLFKESIALALVLTVSFHAKAQTGHKEKMVAAWERVKVYTKEYLDAATQDVYDFKPTPEIRSFSEQMHHLVVDNYKITREASSQAATISNYKDIEKIRLKTKAEVIQAVQESYNFAIASIKSKNK